jgi:hypothetical protein
MAGSLMSVPFSCCMADMPQPSSRDGQCHPEQEERRDQLSQHRNQYNSRSNGQFERPCGSSGIGDTSVGIERHRYAASEPNALVSWVYPSMLTEKAPSLLAHHCPWATRPG